MHAYGVKNPAHAGNIVAQSKANSFDLQLLPGL